MTIAMDLVELLTLQILAAPEHLRLATGAVFLWGTEVQLR